MTIASEDPVSLPVAAHRVAGELDVLTGRLQRLEDGLEMVFSRSGHALDGKTIGMLQEVDVVLQSVAALATYLERVSDATTNECKVCTQAALKAIPLRDMARRLSGCTEERDNTGHAELF